MKKIIAVLVLVMVIMLVGCADYGTTYSPPPHEIWRVSFVDYDSNGEEIKYGVYDIVEYTMFKNNVKVVYYDQTKEKNVVITLGSEDYIQIEVKQNFDIIKGE